MAYAPRLDAVLRAGEQQRSNAPTGKGFSMSKPKLPPKARPAMIDKLRELSTSLYPSKPALVVKHALPTAFRLLEDNRADLRTGTVQLLRMLHVLLGPSLFEHAQRAPSAVQNRLADVIQTI